MRTYSTSAARMAVLFLVCAGIVGTSWQKKPAPTTRQLQTDTIPKEKKADKDETIISGDLDDALGRLREADMRIDEQFDQAKMQKMQAELQKAMTKLQSREMKDAMARALSQVDMQKIQQQAAKIDWEKMQESFQKMPENMKGLSEEDMMAAKERIESAMENAELNARQWKMNSEKIEKATQKAMKEWDLHKDRYEADMARAAKEMDMKLKMNLDLKMDKVHEKLNLAMEELEAYKSMLSDMEKDGLIKSGEPYDIEYDSGNLIINGKKQPAGVTDKYRHYFKKGKMRLKSDGAIKGKKVIVV